MLLVLGGEPKLIVAKVQSGLEARRRKTPSYDQLYDQLELLSTDLLKYSHFRFHRGQIYGIFFQKPWFFLSKTTALMESTPA